METFWTILMFVFFGFAAWDLDRTIKSLENRIDNLEKRIGLDKSDKSDESDE